MATPQVSQIATRQNIHLCALKHSEGRIPCSELFDELPLLAHSLN